MFAKLSIHVEARLSKDRTFGTGEIFRYEVRGYPIGEGAFIPHPAHQDWATTRWKNNITTDEFGDFPTPEEALAVLQYRYEKGRLFIHQQPED